MRKPLVVNRCCSLLSQREWCLLVVGLATWALQLPGRPASAACAPDKQCLPRITVDGLPVAPSPLKTDGSLLPGTGLCGAFRQSGNPAAVFKRRDAAKWPADAADFPDSVNAFMDGPGTGVDGPRIDKTLTTWFDLSNFVNIVGDDASGDYGNTTSCAMQYGCDFPGSMNASLTSGFGTRFRGFFNVRPEWAGQPMHLGFFADNAVAVTVFAKPKPPAPAYPLTPYLLISHGLDFNPKIRVTNQVIFKEAGLYPIEISHAQFDSAAILEFAVLFNQDDFQDIDELSNPGQPKLSQMVSGKGAGMDRSEFLLSLTQPTAFFQTTSGAPPYMAADQCRQCPRNFANAPNQPTNICDPGYFCNEAAVCSPCVGNQFCGKSCQPCQAPTPYCIPSPVDPMDATCVQCRDTPDCAVGQLCVGNICVTPNQCCPETPRLISPDATRPTLRVCSQCATDADCEEGSKCDLVNARCVDKIPDCNSDDKCGKDCVDCKTVSGNRPHCLNGQVCVQCRNDFECDSGKYCLSGDCVPCLTDRHCGPTCKSCGRSLVLSPDGKTALAQVSDKPFCLHADNTVGNAVCVRCTQDSDCGEGGRCDPGTHDCVNKCAEDCSKDGKLCDGSRCVDCYNSAQCPCGVCDLSTGTCSEICQNNSDCMGNQCCIRTTGKCQPGRCAGTAGGALCGCSVAAVAPPIADNNTLSQDGVAVGSSRGVLVAALAMLAALAFRRRLEWMRRRQ